MLFRSRSRRLVLVLATVAMATAQAMADDFAPPAWRGSSAPYQTLQAWDFLTSANPVQPDDPTIAPIVGDGGGSPMATMNNMHWESGNGDGGWIANSSNGGIIQLDIPNWVDQEPRKLLRIQTTFQGSAEPLVLSVSGIDPSVPAGVVGEPLDSPVTVSAGQVYEDWFMQPNPDRETVLLLVPADVLLDQIVVDTISTAIPEPAFIPSLALGIACAASARRHRSG
jgi:hypothetical protein